MRLRVILRAVRVAGLLAVLLAAGCSSSGLEQARYTAQDLATGEEVSVADLYGRPALLVSWATWCNECDEELEGLQRFAASEAARGLELVAVNLDVRGDHAVQEKIAEHGLTTRLWRDPRNDFKKAFGALGVPTTVLVAADGTVAGIFPGAVDFEDEAVLEAVAELREAA